MVDEEHCKGLLVMPESGELTRDILLDLRLHVEEAVVDYFGMVHHQHRTSQAKGRGDKVHLYQPDERV